MEWFTYKYGTEFRDPLQAPCSAFEKGQRKHSLPLQERVLVPRQIHRRTSMRVADRKAVRRLSWDLLPLKCGKVRSETASARTGAQRSKPRITVEALRGHTFR